MYICSVQFSVGLIDPSHLFSTLSLYQQTMLRARSLLALKRFNSTSAPKDYSSTISLPSTNFSNRSNSELIQSTLKPQVTTQLYNWNLDRKVTNIDDLFILHDGPPYANADIHVGHALNKLLKDFINRFHLLQGKKVYYRMGWDCHGLPIELKAVESLQKELAAEVKKITAQLKSIKSEENPDLYKELEQQLLTLRSTKPTAAEINTKATAHAYNSKASQSKDFEKLGIMTDYNTPYLTLDKSFVTNQLKMFKLLVDNQLIKRNFKPVYWSCENQTALAEGELEYNNEHKSTAVYVKFPLTSGLKGLTDVNLLIWTSTPWTIPANKAVAVNQNLQYTILSSLEDGNLLVASDLVESIMKLNPELTQTGITISGNELINLEYQNPVLKSPQQTFPIIHGSHVTNTAGTGLVHTAPGHGNDDYLACLKLGIAPYSPVDKYGKYTDELPEVLSDLIGKRVLKDGNELMINKMNELKMTFYVDPNYIHSYPYDWRSKKPIVIRATPQWFIDVSKIKDETSESIENKIDFLPERGRNRLLAFVKTRNEWCISRQRSWGVPIPVIYDSETDEPIISAEVINKIISVIEIEDISNWFNGTNEDINRYLPDSYHNDGKTYYKGQDTMDVWFDSGSSWTTIEEYLTSQGLLDQAKERGYLSNLYLEGSDQHRGWFQSSLLVKIGSKKSDDPLVLPYKQIVTHGFTLDQKGNKMSKSLGNVILPNMLLEGNKQQKIPQLGIDGLRLWVSSSDYTNEVSIGPVILSHIAENLKKIRYTFKFLLGNLNGFKSGANYDSDLDLLDKCTLHRLRQLEINTLRSYQNYNFSRVIKDINQFINVDLSSTYFHIKKDILYTDSLDSKQRLATQTVLNEILKFLAVSLSPILPIMTQEVWNNSNELVTKGLKSPAMNQWYELPSEYNNPKAEFDFNNLQLIIDNFKLLLDKGTRLDKVIKNPLEVQINLNFSSDSQYVSKLLTDAESQLADYFVVSKVSLNEPLSKNEFIYKTMIEVPLKGDEGFERVQLEVTKSNLEKCPRCWKFNKVLEEELCHKCDDVVNCT